MAVSVNWGLLPGCTHNDVPTNVGVYTRVPLILLSSYICALCYCVRMLV